MSDDSFDTGNSIAVIGLGYVGLPLAVSLSKKFKVFGFDVSHERIDQLSGFIDSTGEINSEELKSLDNIWFTTDISKLKQCSVYILALPTPIDCFNTPDLSALQSGFKTVAEVLSLGDIVISESTVYPGCTEQLAEDLILDKTGMVANKDYYLGYSPERINPGRDGKKLIDIVKVIACPSSVGLNRMRLIYSNVTDAGLYATASIPVAEASKLVENIQRDVNVALMNELDVILRRLNLSTLDVLDAAKTKWNFLDFYPGLVGGHCIGVDPYYLIHKCNEVGLSTDIISGARRVNASYSNYLISNLYQFLLEKNLMSKHLKILVLGLSFKPNCPDLRNSKAVEIFQELTDAFDIVYGYEPMINRNLMYQMKQNQIKECSFVESDWDIALIITRHEEFFDHIYLSSELSNKFPKCLLFVDMLTGQTVKCSKQ